MVSIANASIDSAGQDVGSRGTETSTLPFDIQSEDVSNATGNDIASSTAGPMAYTSKSKSKTEREDRDNSSVSFENNLGDVNKGTEKSQSAQYNSTAEPIVDTHGIVNQRENSTTLGREPPVVSNATNKAEASTAGYRSTTTSSSAKARAGCILNVMVMTLVLKYICIGCN